MQFCGIDFAFSISEATVSARAESTLKRWSVNTPDRVCFPDDFRNPGFQDWNTVILGFRIAHLAVYHSAVDFRHKQNQKCNTAIKVMAMRFESAATVLARASSTLKQRIVKTHGKDWNPGTFLIYRISRLKLSNLWISNMAYSSHSTSISPKFQAFEIAKLNRGLETAEWKR